MVDLQRAADGTLARLHLCDAEMHATWNFHNPDIRTEDTSAARIYTASPTSTGLLARLRSVRLRLGCHSIMSCPENTQGHVILVFLHPFIGSYHIPSYLCEVLTFLCLFLASLRCCPMGRKQDTSLPKTGTRLKDINDCQSRCTPFVGLCQRNLSVSSFWVFGVKPIERKHRS